MTSELVGRVPVVFVLDNMRYGGTELNAVRTAALLDRSRFDLRVVCLSGDGPLTERYRALGVPIETLPMKSLYGTSMFVCGYRFVRYLRANKVQVVHAHDMYSNIFVAAWTRLAGTKVVIASRRWWHSLPNTKLRYGNIAAFRTVDAVLANSPQVARSVVETEGISPLRINVVPNFVDDAAFAPLSAAERAATREGWGVGADTLAIGCVARLVPVKNHETLIRAFAEVRLRVPGSHLVLVGDGECRSSLEGLAAQIGVAPAVTFVGEVRDGQNQHRAFDVSVLCSLSEGFPNSLVEAMAAGIPIVATSVGGTVDAVTDGLNGFLVPPQQPTALASALGTLLDDAVLRRTMGQAGHARAMERYRAAAVIAQLEGMYERLLAERAS
jgi:glycosyltransferase involved in cell wall biosynthesis